MPTNMFFTNEREREREEKQMNEKNELKKE